MAPLHCAAAAPCGSAPARACADTSAGHPKRALLPKSATALGRVVLHNQLVDCRHALNPSIIPAPLQAPLYESADRLETAHRLVRLSHFRNSSAAGFTAYASAYYGYYFAALHARLAAKIAGLQACTCDWRANTPGGGSCCGNAGAAFIQVQAHTPNTHTRAPTAPHPALWPRPRPDPCAPRLFFAQSSPWSSRCI